MMQLFPPILWWVCGSTRLYFPFLNIIVFIGFVSSVVVNVRIKFYQFFRYIFIT